MNNINKIIIGILAVTAVLAGVIVYQGKKPTTGIFGATILTTNSTDTISTFRTNVNTSLSNLNSAIGAGTVSTSSAITVNNFPYWASTSGQLAGTSTLQFTAGTALFEVLGLASTSQLGVTSGTITNLRYTSATGTNLQGTNLNFTSATGTNLLSTNINFTSATGTNLVSTNLNFTSATGTNFLTSNLNVTNGNEYRKRTASIAVMNPATTHSNGVVAFSLPNQATLNAVICYSAPNGTSTVMIDRRASSTPLTAGTDMLSAQILCGNTATSTTSFASSTVTAQSNVNVDFDAIAGAPSSTVLIIEFTYAD